MAELLESCVRCSRPRPPQQDPIHTLVHGSSGWKQTIDHRRGRVVAVVCPRCWDELDEDDLDALVQERLPSDEGEGA